MPKNRVLIETSCDSCIYPLPLFPDSQPIRVAYREWNAPVNADGMPIEADVFEAPTSKPYLHAVNLGEPPQTQRDAVTFTRLMFLYMKRPVWFHFVPSNSIIVYPPPPNDGDLLIVEWLPDEIGDTANGS